jgi:rare lipoprotein A
MAVPTALAGEVAESGPGPAAVPTPATIAEGAGARPSGVEVGIACVYAAELEGRPTASGALYESQKLTAAHRSLPFGSRIRVADALSGKGVVVTVNDRWSGAPGQIVNLSRRAADELGLRGNGQRKVELTVERLGDGRRQPGAARSTALLLPERIDGMPSDRAGRTRLCANEADILGLREALWETHVRNCLGRKTKTGVPAVEVKAR